MEVNDITIWQILYSLPLELPKDPKAFMVGGVTKKLTNDMSDEWFDDSCILPLKEEGYRGWESPPTLYPLQELLYHHAMHPFPQTPSLPTLTHRYTHTGRDFKHADRVNRIRYPPSTPSSSTPVTPPALHPSSLRIRHPCKHTRSSPGIKTGSLGDNQQQD